MPRYYFALNGSTAEDEGEDLPDDAAARGLLAVIAEELGRNRKPCQEPVHVTVFDDQGHRVGEAWDLPYFQ